MNIFVTFHYSESDINELIISLTDMYPSYLQEPLRLKEIIGIFKLKETDSVTLIIEEEHVDKQYRDSYYSYFSQKYSDFKKNCIRLSFFVGTIKDSDFMGDVTLLERDAFIGCIVLRPLNVGSIGNTLLNPNRLAIKGYVQTCLCKVMICGRKFTIRAFPFLTQDNETMTCAETSLYNLILYYGQKYSDYRALTPSEILGIIETATYERVLPSIGVDDLSMAKVLQAAHLNPRFYPYKPFEKSFKNIFHAYVDSGIPFIVGLPSHAVICIGHGEVDFECSKHVIDEIVEPDDIEGTTYYYLNSGHLVDQYIFMDDNKVPYYKSSIEELTEFYYSAIQENNEEYYDDEIQENNEEYYDDEIQENNEEYNDDEIQEDKVLDITQETNDNHLVNNVECLYGEDELNKMMERYDSILVPLSRRVFLDAERALSIFEENCIKNADFLNEISEAYDDFEWGKSAANPIVWRVYLASSNSYKDFKSRTVNNYSTFEYYSSQPYPRFIWVLEIGTLESFSQKEARVEVILDATSSRNSSTWAILSIGYKNHLVFVPAIIRRKCEPIAELLKTIQKEKSEKGHEKDAFKSIDWDTLNEDVKKNLLTNIFITLYDVTNNFTPATFPIFRDSNLKEV